MLPLDQPHGKEGPKEVVVAVHLESLDHCTVSRKDFRQMADEAGIPTDRLVIPTDGEILAFE